MNMATDDSLVVLSAVKLRRLIEAKQISPVELLEACIARIEAVNPFRIVHEGSKQRYLTGSDFDTESFQFAGGALWIGDEFGPFLIKADLKGRVMTFPFFTIENVDVVDATHIVVGNDNNLPFSSSREPNKADDNELILLEVGDFLMAN